MPVTIFVVGAITKYDAAKWLGIGGTVLGVLWLLSDIHLLAVTRQAYGRVPFKEMFMMLRFVARSRIHYYLWLPLVPFSAMAAFHYFKGTVYPTTFVIAITLFWQHVVVYQLFPPSVLMLGTSRTESIQLREFLERALNPYRVIVLLEPTAASPARFSNFQRNILEWDNLRTRDGQWQAVVHPLMDIVPFVVVDVRFPSAGVAEEIHRMVTTGLIHKAVFVEDRGASGPFNEQLKFIATTGLRIVLPFEVPLLLKEMGFSRIIDPQYNPLLSGLKK